jgi:hypothetical protein
VVTVSEDLFVHLVLQRYFISLSFRPLPPITLRQTQDQKRERNRQKARRPEDIVCNRSELRRRIPPFCPKMKDSPLTFRLKPYQVKKAPKIGKKCKNLRKTLKSLKVLKIGTNGTFDRFPASQGQTGHHIHHFIYFCTNVLLFSVQKWVPLPPFLLEFPKIPFDL